MKKLKLLIASISLFTSAHIFAYNINIPRRIVEVGIDVSGGMNNNYFAAKDMLKKDLVLDFTQMSETLPKQGLDINFNTTENFFIDLNLLNGMRFKLSQGLESDGMITIGKDLFDFLSKGNSPNQNLNFDGNLTASLFMFVDLTYAMNISEWRFEVSPAVYFPIMHAKSKQLSAEFRNSQDGTIGFDVITDAQIFSMINFDNSSSGLQGAAGFDLTASLERKVFNTLQAQAFLRCPIVPGNITYSKGMKSTISYQDTKFLDLVTGNANTEIAQNTEFYDITGQKYYLNRPLHSGVRVAWRPFGKWCTFRGMLGFGVREPFTESAKAYFEYELEADVLLIGIFGFSASSIYKNQIFTNSLGLQFNFRVVELDIAVGVQGSDFFKSFAGTGAVAQVALKFGF
ncbi:MAG: hypothetical protein MR937_03090 [Spirochaetia bacterium]|nr:hypothetical protein [Spirochaetia bacterium]MCI7564772.1 hypothetical protein [Spirochaetia bacterium]